MINLHVNDNDSHLFLTGFCMPQTTAVFQRAAQGVNGTGDHWQPVPNDLGLGLILRAVANQVAISRLGLRDSGVPDLDLSSWLFGRSADGRGRLESWFDGERASTRYRVAVHHTPHTYEQRSMPLVWDEVYHEFESKATPRLVQRGVSAQALCVGREVLEEALQAYRTGPEAARSTLAGLGHPYVHIP